MNRRHFISWVGRLAAPLLVLLKTSPAQHTATMQSGEAVVCPSRSVKCPLGHEGCLEINAPPVVGNAQRDYPDWAQLMSYRMLRCQVCGVLFAEKY
jgi:hypothetical protein